MTLVLIQHLKIKKFSIRLKGFVTLQKFFFFGILNLFFYKCKSRSMQRHTATIVEVYLKNKCNLEEQSSAIFSLVLKNLIA